VKVATRPHRLHFIATPDRGHGADRPSASVTLALAEPERLPVRSVDAALEHVHDAVRAAPGVTHHGARSALDARVCRGMDLPAAEGLAALAGEPLVRGVVDDDTAARTVDLLLSAVPHRRRAHLVDVVRQVGHGGAVRPGAVGLDDGAGADGDEGTDEGGRRDPGIGAVDDEGPGGAGGEEKDRCCHGSVPHGASPSAGARGSSPNLSTIHLPDRRRNGPVGPPTPVAGTRTTRAPGRACEHVSLPSS